MLFVFGWLFKFHMLKNILFVSVRDCFCCLHGLIPPMSQVVVLLLLQHPSFALPEPVISLLVFSKR